MLTYISATGQETRVAYDPCADVFTVNGTRISGELLRELGQDPLLNDDRVFQLVRKDGYVTVHVCCDREVTEHFRRAFGPK